MIKLRLRRESGEPLVVLGLSEHNLDRLRQGLPIVFPLTEIGCGVGELMLMAGETEATIMRELEREIGISFDAAAYRKFDELEERSKKRRS